MAIRVIIAGGSFFGSPQNVKKTQICNMKHKKTNAILWGHLYKAIANDVTKFSAKYSKT